MAQWNKNNKRYAGGELLEPVYKNFFFGRNPVNAVQKNFPAKNCKSYKNLPLFSHSTLKAAGEKIAVKRIFSPLFTAANLTIFCEFE